MFLNSLSNKIKSHLECEIGCYILEELYSVNEYDLIDAYSVIWNYIPANYVPCRENYNWW